MKPPIRPPSHPRPEPAPSPRSLVSLVVDWAKNWHAPTPVFANRGEIFARYERETLEALLQYADENSDPHANTGQAFDYRTPAPNTNSRPVLLASPHSGRFYPDSFLWQTCLDLKALRLSEDSHVDRLITPLAQDGFYILRALFPRAFVDVNRASDEWPAKSLPADQQHTTSPRAKAGFGVIPTHITQHHPLYEGLTLSPAQIKARLRLCYHPYHAALRNVLDDIVQNHGSAILLDMHSMPGASQGYHDRADIILGDRYGASCDPALTASLERRFIQKGYTTVRNQPFAGGFITAHYGRPLQHIHAVQIEINKDLYLDAASLSPHQGFSKLQADLRDIITAATNDI